LSFSSISRRGTLLALLFAAVPASAATAATLHVSVPTHPVKKGHDFAIKLTGSYLPSELQGTAYMVAAFQYDRRPCASTGAQEFKRRDTSFFFFKTVPHSPFTRSFHYSAGAPGPRRICAYLYPKPVSPTDNVTPIARAGGLFRVIKK
jgi:hypothetical protein